MPANLSALDWASIRDAYEAHRHAVVAVEDEYQAHNPRQQWLATFDGRGFLVRQDAGGWHWGLQLESYGFASHSQRIGTSPKIKTAGPQVTYAWDGNLEEWFINDHRGVEHGFTLRQRPVEASPNDRLEFALSVRGELEPKVSPTGDTITFVDASGAAVLNYAALTALDADGKILPAHFETDNPTNSSTIRLIVDERNARYPLTIDPLAQQAYVKASNTDANDEFGLSVAISGDTVVVGAWQESSNAVGVDGDQLNNNAKNAGAAYVFVRSGSTWTQQAYLKASNTDPGDFFGISVAIFRDTIVVGAAFEDSKATGIDGDQNDNSAKNAGAAYVFVRNGTTWSQQAYLKASNTDAGDLFARRVAIYGDTIIAGAYGEDSKSTGINGDQSDNSARTAGAAYIFVRSGTTWSQQAYLKASNTDANDQFGYSLAISIDTVVVGAVSEGSNATGVNGNQNDNSAPWSGAAYVFVRHGTTWSQEAYLKASNTNASDGFGSSVAVSADTVVVGAPNEASNATGIDGNQSDNSTLYAGAAYVFMRQITTWTQQVYLKASNTAAKNFFGHSVALSQGTLVVSANGECSTSAGIGGNQTQNPNTPLVGAVYVFVGRRGLWKQQAYLKAPDPELNDEFGWSVEIFGDTAVVSAYHEGSNAVGINRSGTDKGALDSGAAYIFTGLGIPPSAS
ncbi:MAG: trimeric autotransporter adhesin [Verrucomicrobiota bacterium]